MQVWQCGLPVCMVALAFALVAETYQGTMFQLM